MDTTIWNSNTKEIHNKLQIKKGYYTLCIVKEKKEEEKEKEEHTS